MDYPTGLRVPSLVSSMRRPDLGAVTGVYFALLDPKDFDQIWTHIVAAALSLLLAHFQELETRQIFVAAMVSPRRWGLR